MDNTVRQANALLPDGTERPTLKTIATITGLGVTTVSRALKDAPEIGAETRRRVQEVARQLGYRPNRAGVRLRTGKTNVISLILNTDEQMMGFVSDIIYGISGALAQTPYHLVVTPYSATNDPMQPVRYVVETGSADGIILSRTEPNDERVRYLSERGFPFATHGRTDMGIEHPFHDFDNRAFALEAVRKLASLGRRRLALLAPPPNLSYHGHMRDGLAEGLREAGLTEVAFDAVTTDDSIEAIRQAAQDLMRRPGAPDGVISGSAAATLALVAGAEQAGAVLGEDIDIVAKQNAGLLHLFRPKLLVVNEDIRLAGRELARCVLGRIAGQDTASLQSLSAPDPVAAGDTRPSQAAARDSIDDGNSIPFPVTML